MMINEETLILYYYNDGLSVSERDLVQQALRDDEALQNSYARLCEQMERFDVIEASPAPKGSVARWRHALDAQIDTQVRSRGGFHKFGQRPFALAAAAALVFVTGWWFGGQLNQESTPDLRGPSVVATVPPGSPQNLPASPRPPAVFKRGVSTHLEKSQIQLASLDLGNERESDALVNQIVLQNRFFLQAADNNGASDVARLLRAFEPLLLELASDELPPPDKEQAREQLEFELGVTLTKFARQASNQTNEF